MSHKDILGLVSKASYPPFEPGWVFNNRIDVFVTHTIVVGMLPGGGYDVDHGQVARHIGREENTTEILSYKVVSDPRFAGFDLLGKIAYSTRPSPSNYYYVFVNREFLYYDELKKRLKELKVTLEH
jgi:hypothetical protein